MRLARFGFLLPLTLPLLAVAGHALGGAWNFLVAGCVFGLLPVLDARLGPDFACLAPPGTTARAWGRFFDGILYAWVPVQLALIGWGAALAGAPATPLARVGFTLAVGIVTGGGGIVVAHELGHRRSRVDRGLSCLLLAAVGYAHFHIEHNLGHHARVATAADPASARCGESFWHFLPRTVDDGFASAWRLECARLAAAGVRRWSPANRMLWSVAAPVSLALLLGLAGGGAALAFWVAQSAVAVTLLELVNYIEHYGLVRRRGADGRYEPVAAHHAWNSSQRLTNWYSFNLQRHSHHHLAVTRHYQELEHRAAAPQLPAGYPAMLLLALVPPIWRRTMDPRLAAWEAAGRPAQVDGALR